MWIHQGDKDVPVEAIESNNNNYSGLSREDNNNNNGLYANQMLYFALLKFHPSSSQHINRPDIVKDQARYLPDTLEEVHSHLIAAVGDLCVLLDADVCLVSRHNSTQILSNSPELELLPGVVNKEYDSTKVSRLAPAVGSDARGGRTSTEKDMLCFLSRLRMPPSTLVYSHMISSAASTTASCELELDLCSLWYLFLSSYSFQAGREGDTCCSPYTEVSQPDNEEDSGSSIIWVWGWPGGGCTRRRGAAAALGQDNVHAIEATARVACICVDKLLLIGRSAHYR
ncbi:hypothetical protein EST38_g13413 [Candolleomyces aberdarensis]|uniref:Uncharacterized protein n=1 Tax=Candolleomyces aberdarensis TaxID=2316362 RepID=A0A4Q2CZV3_9AGAR|nr:hypothetical protein EST38_g13413 [Candolleomyces aberdarensis]